MTTKEDRAELLALAEKAYKGPYSWEYEAMGLKHSQDDAKFIAAAANLAPDLAHEVDELSGKVGELEAELARLQAKEKEWYGFLQRTIGSGSVVNFAARWREMEAELEQLREESRWIPVEERLPEDDVMVLVWRKCSKYSYPQYTAVHNSGEWFSNGGRKVNNITHWRPLPAGPEVKP